MDTLDTIGPEILLLKRASRMVIKACGSLHEAGAIAQRSHEQMRRYGDPLCPDTLPIHLALRLEAECGQPYVTRALAELSGHSLRPIKAREPGEALPIAFAEATMAGAEFQSVVARAKADGVITPNEENEIARAGAKAQARIGAVMQAVAGVVAPPPAPQPDGQAARPALRSVGEAG